MAYSALRIKMVFECIRCGISFEPKGFESTETFYTLCEECVDEVLREWEAKSAVEMQSFRKSHSSSRGGLKK